MAEIRLKENESLESALRRFKKQCARLLRFAKEKLMKSPL